MEQLKEIVLFLLPLLTVVGGGMSLLLVLMLISDYFLKSRHCAKVVNFFGTNAILFSLIVSLIATLGSLFYSDVMLYDPCKLCWYQRILMYPQVVLLLVALYMDDVRVRMYTMSLSVLGLLMATYHYLLQIGVLPPIPCTTVGYSLGCSERFFTKYGYVTIPMMALTAFVMILLFWVAQIRTEKK